MINYPHMWRKGPIPDPDDAARQACEEVADEIDAGDIPGAVHFTRVTPMIISPSFKRMSSEEVLRHLKAPHGIGVVRKRSQEYSFRKRSGNGSYSASEI